jgi:hypothetical protein
MTKTYLLILGVFVFCSTISLAQTSGQQPDATLLQIGFSNHKLKGQLSLSENYRNDLTSLTYDAYLKALKENEKSSNQGLAETVRKVDQHYFATKKTSFLIAIYSKEFNMILFDDASGPRTDSVVVLRPGDKVPDLEAFAKKAKFFRE